MKDWNEIAGLDPQPLVQGDMENELGEFLKKAREGKGLTLEEAASRLRVSNQAISNWERGKSAPLEGRANDIRDLYGMTDRWTLVNLIHSKRKSLFQRRSDRIAEHKSIARKNAELVAELTTTVTPAHDAPVDALHAQGLMPLNVPVYGVSVGGDDHDFFFNGGSVDFVRRPPGITNAKRAYAIYVVGDSMMPAFRENDLVYVNPDKPPAIGDHVVVELYPEDDGEDFANRPGKSFIKKLHRRSGSVVVIEQYNPQKEITLEKSLIKAMHRVVPWNELLGL